MEPIRRDWWMRGCAALVAFAALGAVWNQEVAWITPAQPAVSVVTFPVQNVECYVYRDTMECFQYVDDGVPE